MLKDDILNIFNFQQIIAEGTKNIWLSPLRGWDSLTMTFLRAFLYFKFEAITPLDLIKYENMCLQIVKRLLTS